MKGGIFIYCPACHHRQALSAHAEKLELPAHAVCEQCQAHLLVDRSESGGVHVLVEPAGAH